MDGHERECGEGMEDFSQNMHDLKNTHLPPPPCSDECTTTPPPDTETQKMIVLLYHDESTNKGQTWMWATEDIPVIQPKTSLMVSDFGDQHRGFLSLTDIEHIVVTANVRNFPKVA